MSDRLTRRLLDSRGRLGPAARAWLSVMVAGAFATALLVTPGLSRQEAQRGLARATAPAAEHADERAAAWAGMRRVAPLPRLQRDPPRRTASGLGRTGAATASPQPAPAVAAPVEAAPEAPTAAPPAATGEPTAGPVAPPPEPTTAPVAPAQPAPADDPQPDPPEETFESSGDFDSSG